MKTSDEALVVLLRPFNHPTQRIREPLSELPMWGKDMGHQEVHQGPELHQVVLKGGTGQEEATLAVEVE